MRKNTLLTSVILIILCSISFFMKSSVRNMMKSTETITTETITTKDNIISIDIPKGGMKNKEEDIEYDIDYIYLNKKSLLDMRITCIDDFEEGMRVEDVEVATEISIKSDYDVEVKQHNRSIDNVSCSILEYELTYGQIDSDLGKPNDKIKYIHIISSVGYNKKDIIIVADKNYYVNNREEIDKIIESIKFTGIDTRLTEGGMYSMKDNIFEEKISKNKLLSIKVPENCIEDLEDEEAELCYYNTDMTIEYYLYESNGYTLDETVELYTDIFKENDIETVVDNKVLNGTDCRTIEIEDETNFGQEREIIYILAVIDDIQHEIIISKDKDSSNIFMDNRNEIINSITFN